MLMMKAMLREVAGFILSRLGELKVSEMRYVDLLGEADYITHYIWVYCFCFIKSRGGTRVV
jgi:hypothetical protein